MSKSYLVGGIFAFLLCILFPLTLIWIYLGVSCLDLHIFFYKISVFLATLATFFYRCYTLLFVERLLFYISFILFSLFYLDPQIYMFCVCLFVCIIKCTRSPVQTLNNFQLFAEFKQQHFEQPCIYAYFV